MIGEKFHLIIVSICTVTHHYVVAVAVAVAVAAAAVVFRVASGATRRKMRAHRRRNDERGAYARIRLVDHTRTHTRTYLLCVHIRSS